MPVRGKPHPTQYVAFRLVPGQVVFPAGDFPSLGLLFFNMLSKTSGDFVSILDQLESGNSLTNGIAALDHKGHNTPP